MSSASYNQSPSQAIRDPSPASQIPRFAAFRSVGHLPEQIASRLRADCEQIASRLRGASFSPADGSVACRDPTSQGRACMHSGTRGCMSPADGSVACRDPTSQGRASATWHEIAPRPSTPREAHAPDEGRNQRRSEGRRPAFEWRACIRVARMHSIGAHAFERRACIPWAAAGRSPRCCTCGGTHCRTSR